MGSGQSKSASANGESSKSTNHILSTSQQQIIYTTSSSNSSKFRRLKSNNVPTQIVTSNSENDPSGVLSPILSAPPQLTTSKAYINPNENSETNGATIDAADDGLSSQNQTLNIPSGIAASIISPIARAKTLDIDNVIQRLIAAGSGKIGKTIPLKNPEVITILQVAREIFLSQPALIELAPPVKIVGDIHGQFSDLLRLFTQSGYPPASNYLFLGDYVDRGKQSLETILLLLCYKIKYPGNFFLLRGNHECAGVNKVYGFYDECKRRTNIKIWKTFIDVFDCLPIAAIVAGKIFCVHGGLSPSLDTMEDVRNIVRPTDVPDYGLLNDLLWSDPSESAAEWEDNERGVSYCFGSNVVNHFLTKHDLDLVARAHMVVEDGYEFFGDRTLVTIFSAPNYCGEFNNLGAVMCVSEELMCTFEILKPQGNVRATTSQRRPSPPSAELTSLADSTRIPAI